MPSSQINFVHCPKLLILKTKFVLKKYDGGSQTHQLKERKLVEDGN